MTQKFMRKVLMHLRANTWFFWDTYAALLLERDQLRREVEEARDKALEEAASHILETQIGFGKEDWIKGNNSGVKGSASAIRALKARP